MCMYIIMCISLLWARSIKYIGVRVRTCSSHKAPFHPAVTFCKPLYLCTRVDKPVKPVMDSLDVDGLHESAQDQVELLPVNVLWVPDVLDLCQRQRTVQSN